jgi:hypothetical protein
LPIKAAPVRHLNATVATATATIATKNPHRIVPDRTNPRQRQRSKQKSNPPNKTSTNTRRSSYQDIRHYTSGAKSTVATSQAMQTATEATSVASKVSHVVRFDPVRLVQTLVQKCIIQSPQSGNFVFDWLGLGMTCAVAFNFLPEHVSFLAGSIDSAPIPSPPTSPPPSPTLPPPPPITIIDNLSSRYRAHRNRLQPSRTHATQAAADEPINPMDNLISRFRALRNRLPTPRTQATQATALRNRPLPQSAPSLVTAQCAIDSSKHELR